MNSNTELPDIFLPRALNGIEPKRHYSLTDYVDTLEIQVHTQNRHPGDAFFLIADHHALAKGFRDDLGYFAEHAALTCLACGVNPERAVLYRQSDVPQLFELLWLVSSVVPSRFANAELVTKLTGAAVPTVAGTMYSLLMAVDVLALRATLVAGSRLRIPELAFVDEVVIRMNDFLGENYFPVPTTLLSELPETRHGLEGPSMLSGLAELRSWVDSIAASYAIDPSIRTWFQKATGKFLDDAAAQRVREAEELDEELRSQVAEQAACALADVRSRYQQFANRPDDVHDILQNGGMRVREEVRVVVEDLRQRFHVPMHQLISS